LRKTKLDELPQLFNVLAGHMSLVGPRPEVLPYVAKYTSRQRAVLQVRPGITSPQIDFDEEDVLAGGVDKEEMYLTTVLPAKLESDLAYCDNIGFLEDQKVILQTIAGMVGRIAGFPVRRQQPGPQDLGVEKRF
jgi:lipopolysaccharide/colanic/teichoic acid biosynthesis glycosyltransferase